MIKSKNELKNFIKNEIKNRENVNFEMEYFEEKNSLFQKIFGYKLRFEDSDDIETAVFDFGYAKINYFKEGYILEEEEVVEEINTFYRYL